MIKKFRYGELVPAYNKPCLILSLFFFMPRLVAASENSFNTSVSLQQDFTSNYLMSVSNPESLLGEYLIPTAEYRYGNATESLSANIQESIQRFDRKEFNGEYPSLKLGFKKALERSNLAIDYDVNIQSTRTSEFNDSGTIEKKASNRTDKATRIAWQFQSSQNSIISFSGSKQTVDYESDTYADLENRNIQVSWQYQFNEKINFYSALSTTKYEAKFFGSFPIVPVLLHGYLLCPPSSVLVSEYACASFNQVRGNAINDTDSNALQLGLKWNIREHIKFSAGAGVSPSRTVQNIEIPQLAVEYGQPLNEDVVFGGKRATRSDSTVKLADMSINYVRERSSFDFSLDSKIQPSSTGTIWKTTSARLAMKYSLSDVNSLGVDINYSNFRSLDERVISISTDRDYFDGHIEYTHFFTQTLMSTFSIGYRFQKENASAGSDANAVLGTFAINYVPRQWKW